MWGYKKISCGGYTHCARAGTRPAVHTLPCAPTALEEHQHRPREQSASWAYVRSPGRLPSTGGPHPFSDPTSSSDTDLDTPPTEGGSVCPPLAPAWTFTSAPQADAGTTRYHSAALPPGSRVGRPTVPAGLPVESRSEPPCKKILQPRWSVSSYCD